MRIQIDLRIDESCRELFDAVRRKTAGQIVGNVLGLEVG